MSRLLVVALLLVSGWAEAHTFPEHSEPRVGHTVEASPPSVRIWFDGRIEPVFSKIRVEDANRRRVDKGDSRVDPTDRTLLEVGLPALPSGRYRVFWSVVTRDGHRTEGDFAFTVK